MLNLRAALRPLVAALVGLALAGASPAAAAARAATDAFLEDWLARHPERATLLDDHRFDRRLPDFSAAAPRAQDALRQRALAEWPTGSAERLLIESLAPDTLPFETVPGRLRLALIGPMRANRGSPCGRAMATTARLRGMPEALRELTRLAGRADWPRQRTEAALDEVEDLLQRCRVEMADAFVACREARAVAPLAEADSQAVRALEAFRELARAQLERGGAVEAALAPGDLAGALARVAGATGRAPDPAEVLGRVRRELEALGPAPAADTLATDTAARARLDAAGEKARRGVAPAKTLPGARVRHVLGLDALRDAHARWGEAALVEAEPADTRAALEHAWRARERERLARAAVELMLRVEGVPPEAAAEWLARTAAIEPAAAARAVRRAWVTPEFAPATLALWGVRDLHHEFAARVSARALPDAVRRAGAIPLSALRAELAAASGTAPEGRR